MFTLPGKPGVYANHPIYHHTADFEPVLDGVEVCRVSLHRSPIDGHQALVDVAPGCPLPADWHWATPSEIAALTGSQPTDRKDLADAHR